MLLSGAVSFLLLCVSVLCFNQTKSSLRAKIRAYIYFSVSSKVLPHCRIIINTCYLLSSCRACVPDSLMGTFFTTLKPSNVLKWNALINTTNIDLFRALEDAVLLNGQRVLRVKERHSYQFQDCVGSSLLPSAPGLGISKAIISSFRKNKIPSMPAVSCKLPLVTQLLSPNEITYTKNSNYKGTCQ